MGTVAWMSGAGPLVAFAEGFRHELGRLGYTAGAVKHHMVLMGQLDRWLSAQGLTAGDLSVGIAEQFFASRRARGQRRVPTMESLSPLFGYLIQRGVLAHDALRTAPTAQDDVLDRYCQHLVHERGLMASTVLRYVRFARRFLAERAQRENVSVGFEGLASADVHAFMLDAGAPGWSWSRPSERPPTYGRCCGFCTCPD